MNYEYKIVSSEAKKGMFKNTPAMQDEKLLNELGSEGWELIAVNPIQGASIKSYGGATVGYTYHLRRAK